MSNIMTRLFTVIMLMAFSMGASADVKVLYGEDGSEKFEGKGGTIEVKQEPSKEDATKVTVYLGFIPKSGYTFDASSLEVYAVVSPDGASTRAPQVSGKPLDLTEDKSENPKEKHYHVDIDSKLALWVKKAEFISGSKEDPEPTRDDYSGTYYIGSVGYKEANTTTNYYLCPTEGWCYYQATDNFTGTDNGMPFLTTYQCRDGVYDVRKAIWTIKKAPAPNEAYYYIKQSSTGRYLTSNGKINTTNNADRLRVHLEAVAQENLDDKELFTIESDNGHYVISPKDVVGGAADRKWLVVNGGNQNALTGQSGKQNGPTGYTNTAGIIGVYTRNDGNAPFYLEEAIIPPTFTINADGSVELSSLEGTSIRYTTDDTTPTAGSTPYTTAIQVTSTMTSIKAIAIRTSDNKASDAVTLPLHTYTYYIVNKSGDIAIKQVVKQAEGKALGSMADYIPAEIRSPYLIGETVTFYSFYEAFTSAEQLTDEVKISATPQADANIYVTYSTDHLSEKFLRLRGARAFNFVTNDGYAFDNGGSLAYDNVEANKKQPNHLWNISGGDPYAVQIKNLGTHKYLVSSTMPTLSLAGTATNNFILMEESAATNAAYEPVSLMVATGTGTTDYATKAVNAYPVNSSVTYHLIDKAGKLIVSVPSTSSELALPDEWVSPLVSEYQYYKDATLSGTAVGSSCNFTGATTVTSPFDVGSGGNIYVTYNVGSAVDLTGTNNYMLKFSGGEYFHQEDGHDGINKEGHTTYGVTTATKAIYPYNNGDFNLYVYGQEQWESQLASGASTRTRWLWKFVSRHDGTNLTGAAVDPYHVVVKSNQNHSVKDKDLENTEKDKNYGESGLCSSYLQTYKPSDYSEVITNIAYENVAYCDAYPSKMMVNGQPSSMVNGQPTEYMILGTSLQSMTLKTFNEVEGERRVVDSFEQYWKNNPTVETLASTNPAADNATLAEMGWHQFTSWAYSAPWGGGAKRLAEETHWYQTISMGSEFTVEEVSLAPQVILLDQHGWEIMRTPLTDVTTLRKYDSPMVEQYHWYPTAEKVSGYHKYRVSNQEITVYDSDRKATSGRFIHNSNTLAYTPYDYFETIKDENGWVTQDDRVKSDFYVTYTVKSEYADAYTGAATSNATIPSAYLLKQGGSYASTNGSVITATTAPANMEDIPPVMQWNLRPNFDIDREMGYKYAGETGAQEGAKSKEDTDQDNYDEGRNGFDPYNVQIQSLAYPLRYFTANTSGIALEGGAWKGTSDAVNLQNLNTKQTADGYDQTKLSITNATFMVVDDGAGNMRLMPRFDNSKVVTFSSSTPFKTLEAQTAAATAGDEGTGIQTLWLALVPKAQEVHSLSEISDMNGHYLLAQDFTFDSGSLGTSEHPFRGIIDGQLNTLSGTTSVPLVAYADGAIIRNVILEEVGINETTGNVGAIACNAVGSTRIYNCGILGGTVEGTAYTGGLVGLLDGTSRVINCYSYADISGGTNAAGIVGYNNVSTTMTNLKTMVMNCMFYGNITNATTMKPVYGGKVISNAGTSGVNNYNYYRNGKDVTFDNDYSGFGDYYCTLPADEEYLTRFEYYRSILNSNKKLCTWWINGTSGTAPTDADVKAVGIAKWVLDPEIAPYPILKIWAKYPSVINQDKTQVWDPRTEDADGNPLTPHWVNRSSAPAYHGKQLGTISVTVNAGAKHAGTGATSTTLSSVIVMDMDTLNHDYSYAKIQLPYYNEVFGDPSIVIPATTADDYTEKWNQRYGGNYKDYVVTGWKITAVSGGTPGTFKGYAFASSGGVSAAAITPDDTSGNPWEDGFNFADRNCTNKDLYAKSGRVFAQGGYYYVPEGVTAITIEAYWGKAVYLHNKEHSLDRVNVAAGADGAASAEYGTAFSPAGTLSDTFQGQTVQTTLQDAISQLTKSASLTVYDQAIVLIGNVQVKNRSQSVGRDKTASNSRPFTIMSIDEDMDNEPDYCLELQFRQKTDRPTIHPVRFDFLPVPELGLAIKTNQNAYAIGVFIPQGHFEITETSFMHTTQFEYDGDAGRVESPIILNGGHFEQIVVRYCNGNKDKVSYFLLGGHFRIKRFTPGHHASNNTANATVRHCAVNVIGGDFPELYLSGIYQPGLAIRADNPHCYINGGKFGTLAGAGYEQVDGNVTFKIDHALINYFYGGGLNGAKPVTGSIDVTINNSIVYGIYCGGPEVGPMTKPEGEARKTVTTTADNTIFDKYFGGGNGGTSYYREQKFDNDVSWPSSDSDWTGATYYFSSFDPLNFKNSKKYDSNKGYHDQFVFEIFNSSNGLNANAVIRTIYIWAQFGTTITGTVTNTLTNCTVEHDFYGGGNLGTVDGDVISTLTSTHVKGSVFGGGYSAEIPRFRVHDTNAVHVPTRNKAGLIDEQGYLDFVQDNGEDRYYRWTNDKNNNTASTNAPTYWSEVDGEWKCYTPISLEGLGEVHGATTLTIDGTSQIDGNVFGGGDASAVKKKEGVDDSGNTTVILQGKAEVLGNVFGGGNEAPVEGSATVNIQ